MSKRFIFLFIFFILLSVEITDAATEKEKFELQKECSKEGEDFFKKNWLQETGWIRDYTTHYNSDLNKCLIEIRETQILNSKDDQGNIVSYSVMNVLSRKELVNIAFHRLPGKKYWESEIFDCTGKTAPCQSTKEFQT